MGELMMNELSSPTQGKKKLRRKLLLVAPNLRKKKSSGDMKLRTTSL